MTEVPFAELLSRADEEALQELIGKHVVRLLASLDPQLTTPSRLREISIELTDPAVMLRDPRSRRILLEALQREQADALALRLGFDAENSLDRILAAPIQRSSRLESELLNFFGVIPPEPIVRNVIQRVSPAMPSYGLFDHQRRAFRGVREVLTGGEKRVVLHMPTGSGKTRTAMHVVSSFLSASEPSVVCWLAFSEELCEQAASEFEEAWSALGDREVDIIRFWGAGRELEIDEIEDGFLVAGLNKTYQRAKSDADFITRLADRTALVVIDEAHQAVAETYSFVLDFMVDRNDRSRLLGLTATPGRTWDDVDEDARLADFFDRNKVTLVVDGYENPIEYLIDHGYLARPTFVSLPFHSAEPLSSEQLRRLAASLDIPEGVLRHLAEDDQRNLLVVTAVHDLIRRGHARILVFAATVEHATLLATVLRARGVDAAAVTGETPAFERSRLVTRFKNADPDPRVLVNFGVLTAGFDAPRTSAAVIARPTQSLVLYSQMVGRATRGPRAGGNSAAEILTIVDTQLPGFGDLSEAFINWEDVWNDNEL